MQISSKQIHKSEIMKAYEQNSEFQQEFFDYGQSKEYYAQRLDELANRPYQREELAETIHAYMEPFGISDAVSTHLEELANDGVVIVGGQQAGVLTGPLYSVHKAITVILIAKQQRKELNKPVIPVFWVAGEDHDIEEINHVYTEQDGRPVKQQYPERFVLKNMASDTVYDSVVMESYIRLVFRDYQETAYTKQLLEDVLTAMNQEQTFTRFFVRLMNNLFSKHGLLIMDSADKSLRKLEANYFKKLITQSKELAEKISTTEQRFVQQGFGAPIQAAEDAAHLFYVHETGRILLSRKDDLFVNELAGLRFTQKEMLETADQTPWLLSNNVATRPIMQDFVLPVLAFVGGPGEIAYWALLKEAFHHLEIKMPILVPRISITLVTVESQHALEKCSLTLDEVMDGETVSRREEFLEEQSDMKLEQLLTETEVAIEQQYDKIVQHIADVDLRSLGEKNRAYHLRQVKYLRNKSEDVLLRKYAAAIQSYNLLEGGLYPERNLQERTYTPYPFLNEYGPQLIDDLLQAELPMNGEHLIIFL